MIKKILVISLVSISLNVVAMNKQAESSISLSLNVALQDHFNNFFYHSSMNNKVAEQLARTSSIEAVQNEAQQLHNEHCPNNCFGRFLMHYWYSKDKQEACTLLQNLAKGKWFSFSDTDLKEHQERRIKEFGSILPKEAIKKQAVEELSVISAVMNLVVAKSRL